MQIEQTEFDLTDLIDKTISTFGVQAHSKGLELIARIAPGVQTQLIGDPLRLRQILVNFLGNAIKFTDKGEVVLEVNRGADSNEGAELRFTVSDTGIGIAQNKLQEIFASFSQADSSTTRKYGGTGPRDRRTAGKNDERVHRAGKRTQQGQQVFVRRAIRVRHASDFPKRARGAQPRSVPGAGGRR
jgi:hypothetical protein